MQGSGAVPMKSVRVMNLFENLVRPDFRGGVKWAPNHHPSMGHSAAQQLSVWCPIPVMVRTFCCVDPREGDTHGPFRPPTAPAAPPTGPHACRARRGTT